MKCGARWCMPRSRTRRISQGTCDFQCRFIAAAATSPGRSKSDGAAPRRRTPLRQGCRDLQPSPPAMPAPGARRQPPRRTGGRTWIARAAFCQESSVPEAQPGQVAPMQFRQACPDANPRRRVDSTLATEPPKAECGSVPKNPVPCPQPTSRPSARQRPNPEPG